MTATPPPAPARSVVITGLRRWAEGAATDEAAVELLIGLGTRFTDPHCRWIRPCGRAGWYWLDPEQLYCFRGRLTLGEWRVLTLVVALLTGEPGVESGRAAA